MIIIQGGDIVDRIVTASNKAVISDALLQAFAVGISERIAAYYRLPESIEQPQKE